mmetsp:Transcript_10705/g.22753  ORF Transcript_10705/g.22753 Transcript_10705/m.22753 type:complete len:384 (-) Transcript_10705:258-1409(-)
MRPPLLQLLLLCCASFALGFSLANAAFSPSRSPINLNHGLKARACLPRKDRLAQMVTDDKFLPSKQFGLQPPDLTLLAPAKINLFLRILGRREDGFHELASLFQTVSLFDTLDFWSSPADDSQPLYSMEVTDSSLCADLIPTDESNLVMKALHAFSERTSSKQRLHCRLHKEIPAEGGLGGGSSDAATALHAANRLAGFPLSEDELIKLAADLGSDVGFFLSGGTAYCTGRGELVDFRKPLEPCTIYLIKPKVGCSTPAVYGALGLEKGQQLSGLDPEALLKEFEEGSIYKATFINDLEPPAFQVVPLLREIKEDLEKLGFPAVMMSGSGSTIFCIGSPGADAPNNWQEELVAKYDVDIFEQASCSRLNNANLWYAEQPAETS